MVLNQVSSFFFSGNISHENVFYDILQRKNAFLRYKKQKSKKSKSFDFSKGVNPWFWSKNDHFSNFFFQAIQARKVSFMIFYNEKTFFYAIKTRSSKSRKISLFFKRVNLLFQSKNGQFSNVFFQPIQARKMFFTIFQTEKTPLQTVRTGRSKSSKIDIFEKWLTHGFGPKMANFLPIFLGNIGQENVFTIFQNKKNAFVDCKNKKFKKSKN